jgi:hypothetical protein
VAGACGVVWCAAAARTSGDAGRSSSSLSSALIVPGFWIDTHTPYSGLNEVAPEIVKMCVRVGRGEAGLFFSTRGSGDGRERGVMCPVALSRVASRAGDVLSPL